MGRRGSRPDRWSWLSLAIPMVILTAGCGNVNVDEPSSGAITSATVPAAPQSSVQIDIPEPEGQEAPPPGLDTTSAAPGGLPPYSVVAQATVPTMVARSSPDDNAAPIADFTNPTNSGSPLVFRAVDGGGSTADWIEVHLPIQPNGSTGWVRRQEVDLTNNPYRLEIDRASYSLKVFYRNDLWLETSVAIGNGATPTPVGQFYLLELLQPPDQGGPYGSFAFGLSGFSEVLESFGGADSAIIGLHGTNDPSSIGTDVSHGCIRVENTIIEELASIVPLGTGVTIT